MAVIWPNNVLKQQMSVKWIDEPTPQEGHKDLGFNPSPPHLLYNRRYLTRSDRLVYASSRAHISGRQTPGLTRSSPPTFFI
jgi:hypothetical protein